MTALQKSDNEYDVLVVERIPNGDTLAFTYGKHIAFDKIPVHVLFPQSSVPDAILEVGFRHEGQQIPFKRERRKALEDWFANHRPEQ